MYDEGGETSPRSPFGRFTADDVFDLVADYPLAWVTPMSGNAPPSLLPLLAEGGGEGGLTALFGHISRRNPLVCALEEDGRATILFTGPQAYLSTSLVSDPRWAPTWIYAQLSISATLRFVPEETSVAVDRLTGHREGRAGTGWRPEMVGSRHSAMIGAIIAFRATVTTLHGRFKLCQDETPERLCEIVAGLEDAILKLWIERFNPAR